MIQRGRVHCQHCSAPLSRDPKGCALATHALLGQHFAAAHALSFFLVLPGLHPPCVVNEAIHKKTTASRESVGSAAHDVPRRQWLAAPLVLLWIPRVLSARRQWPLCALCSFLLFPLTHTLAFVYSARFSFSLRADQQQRASGTTAASAVWDPPLDFCHTSLPLAFARASGGLLFCFASAAPRAHGRGGAFGPPPFARC